jgi:hypothetical protein
MQRIPSFPIEISRDKGIPKTHGLFGSFEIETLLMTKRTLSVYDS